MNNLKRVLLNELGVSSSVFRNIGQVLISCFCSLQPLGPVTDGKLGARLMKFSACSYLSNFQQQSLTVYYYSFDSLMVI